MQPAHCEQCGGLNPPLTAPPFVCKFCNAPMRAPELLPGQIWLTDEMVLDHARRMLSGVDATFIHPAIPPKKLTNQRKEAGAALPADEGVLALYDATVFGSASDGFVITSRRICWKNQMEPPGMLAWDQIDPNEVYADDQHIHVGRAEIFTLFVDDDEGIHAWAELIETLARSARPGQAMDEGAELDAEMDRTPGADPAWGGPEVATNPKVSQAGAGWGGTAAPASGVDIRALFAAYPHRGVEPFAAPPYADDACCSLVDVHPTGQVLLAAGGSSIELRHAQNGARVAAIQADDGVLSARFSPDGQWIASGCMDNRAHLFDARTGQARGATDAMKDYVDAVVWLDGSRLALGSQSGEVWIVDSRTMQVLRKVLGPDGDYSQLGGLAASPDGTRLYVGVGSRLGCFDVASGKIVWRYDEEELDHGRLSASPRGDLLAVATDRGVALFGTDDGRPRHAIPFGCASNVSWPDPYDRSATEPMLLSWTPTPQFSPRGDTVAVQDNVGNLAFVDVASGQIHPTPRDRGRAFIEAIAWFGDSEHVALGMSDNSLAIWSVRPMVAKLHTRALDDG